MECKDGKDCSKVSEVTTGSNKAQVLSDNIEVVECKVASWVDFCKEFLQLSGAKLCCATAAMECLGIYYKCYHTLNI
ncbi:hypothetical protein ALC57_09666 [Trachymyrmex cornetzi]|uniref:Uncharacterized protein n=1 Tax=Trachymyrmex cornetzi TaxID=471704 RepID=A0A195DYW2_9HYME|nr:hypothetical protein ALC57_09666 [Trachymyrmex cornetzi]